MVQCKSASDFGFVIGAGGMLFPQALGVGYDTIGALVQGDVPGRMLVGVGR